MPNKKVTDLTEVTTPADGDLVYIVDVSDTTDSAAGSSRYVQASNLRGWPRTAAEVTAGVTPVNLQYEPGNVLRYGTNTTPGTTDMTTAIQNACDQAGAGGVPVYVPPGRFQITATINYKGPIRGDGGNNTADYAGGVPLSSQISGNVNGPLIDIDSTTDTDDTDNFWEVSGLHITNFHASGTGIRATGTVGDPATHYLIYNCRIRSCNTGLDLWGFNGQILNTNVLASVTTGIKLTNANAVVISGCDIQGTDAGGTGVSIVSGFGITFVGGAIQSDTGATGVSIAEDVTNVTFLGTYFEGNTVAHVSAGEGGTGNVDDAVVGLTMENCLIATADAPIVLDNVQNIRITGDTTQTPIKTTANTRGFVGADLSEYNSTDVQILSTIVDAGENVGAGKYSFVSNPNFNGGGRGYSKIESINVTVSEENTTTRDGVSCLRVQQSAAGYPRAKLHFQNQSWFASNAAGKRLGVFGWVYIPNITTYNDGTYKPQLALSYKDDTVEQVSGNNFIASVTADGWHWLAGFIDIVDDASTLSDFSVYISPTQSSAASTSHYVLVSDLFVIDNPQNTDQYLVSAPPVHPEFGYMQGNQVVSFDSAAPTDSSVPAAVGDRVYNTSPSAGGNLGWVCTTAGSPGTWTPFGAIEAANAYTPTNDTADRSWDANAAVNGTGIDVAAAGPANVALLSDHDALVAVVQELSDVLATLVTDLQGQGVLQ